MSWRAQVIRKGLCYGGQFIEVQGHSESEKSELLNYWEEVEHGVRRLRIKLAAPPVDDKANLELVKFLSKHLGVAKSRLKLVAGGVGAGVRISRLPDSPFSSYSAMSSSHLTSYAALRAPRKPLARIVQSEKPCYRKFV
ncbi:MAG: DUF167 domain-containing protein [Verrucomicrobiales bacterium]|nr:DUF167 domain-containing protein [Verrucomicrobiales bacterium]